MAKHVSENPEEKQRKLGDLLGEYIDKALQSIPFNEQIRFIEQNLVKFYSEDKVEGVCILYAPDCQILYHFTTLKQREKSGELYYLGVYKRELDAAIAARYLESKVRQFLADRFSDRCCQEPLFPGEHDGLAS